jgi:hypothetical protein
MRAGMLGTPAVSRGAFGARPSRCERGTAAWPRCARGHAPCGGLNRPADSHPPSPPPHPRLPLPHPCAPAPTREFISRHQITCRPTHHRARPMQPKKSRPSPHDLAGKRQPPNGAYKRLQTTARRPDPLALAPGSSLAPPLASTPPPLPAPPRTAVAVHSMPSCTPAAGPISSRPPPLRAPPPPTPPPLNPGAR